MAWSQCEICVLILFLIVILCVYVVFKLFYCGEIKLFVKTLIMSMFVRLCQCLFINYEFLLLNVEKSLILKTKIVFICFKDNG
jgi:hypothetical protein